MFNLEIQVTKDEVSLRLATALGALRNPAGLFQQMGASLACSQRAHLSARRCLSAVIPGDRGRKQFGNFPRRFIGNLCAAILWVLTNHIFRVA
jgi:hypothetical protein